MSNCCMRRPAKFHVDSSVRFWAIANIREGGVKRPPPVKRGLKPEGVDTSVLFVANRSRCYLNLKSWVNFWHLGIGGGTGERHRVTGSPWMRDFNINPMGVAWKEWCQKSVVPPLVGAVPPLLPLGLINDQKMARDPRLSSLRDCQRFVDLFYNSSSKMCFMWL